VINSINQKFLSDMFIKLINAESLEVEMFVENNTCLHWMTEDSVVQEKLLELLIQNKE
jgi:hypothetical protein